MDRPLAIGRSLLIIGMLGPFRQNVYSDKLRRKIETMGGPPSVFQAALLFFFKIETKNDLLDLAIA